jgi:peptidoglycan/xylan/chitin deacetylase (PgdA/CDA1 family)
VKILLRFDDIAENMNWRLMDKCEELFDIYNIKPVMGVIPNNQDETLKSFPQKQNFWKIIKNWQSKGWEISMHGYNHLYTQDTNYKDYFKYGGKSEFFGETLFNQTDKIKKGLEIFKKNEIRIRSFFAPNHTYDNNTLLALKNCGINEIIDGYGLKPFTKEKIKFIPQLFFKLFFLPFGLQTTQIHLNEMNDKDFENFKILIEKKHKNIIKYDEAINLLSDKKIDKFLNRLVFYLLISKRKIKFF